MQFPFENLDVYQKALSLVDTLDGVGDEVRGRLPATRVDQLTRVSMSVALNIAEGTGRRRPNEGSRVPSRDGAQA